MQTIAAILASALFVPAPAIAHGRTVAQGQYRFSAALTMTGIPTADHGRRDSSCSGALVAPRWLITAGHCFRDAGGERVGRTVAERTTATVGRADLTGGGGHVVEIVAVRQSDRADVALDEIDTPITDIAPLPPATAAPRAGEVLRLTGFGLTDGSDPRPTTRLQTGEFTVTSVGDEFVSLSGRAPRPDTSACEHDSGGPYFRTRPGGRAELVAVVSHGPTCPHTGADLSARTDNLTGWISATTRDRGGPATSTVVLLGVLLLAAVGGAANLVRVRARRARDQARERTG
jgi:secreted trypsin-like serine protease